MKIILVGYPGSQRIIPISKYLVDKYLQGFDVVWLNYKGQINGWSKFIADYLKTLENKKIILALDDYLIAEPIATNKYYNGADVVKLCESTLAENEEYPVTTQYCIWDKDFLISLLEQTTSPWDFEITGSRIFKEKDGVFYHLPILKYNVHSALSRRWEGVRLDGLNEEDTKTVQALL